MFAASFSAPDLRHSRGYLYVPCPAHLAATVTHLKGVRHEHGQLLFDRRLYTDQTARLVAARAAGERLAATFQGVGRRTTVTSGDLRQINEHHSEIDLSAGDIVVFERFSANDALMRRPLKFTRRALDKFAQDFSQGRSLLLDHDERQRLGRVFAAKVEKATVRDVEAHWLVTRSYAVTASATPQRLQDVQDAQTGVLGFDSITLAGGKWEMQELEGPDGETRYFFEIDDDPDAWPRLEAWELSFVFLGAVHGAGSKKFDTQESAERESAPDQPDNEGAKLWVLSL